MAEVIIDCENLPCPQPVIRLKRLLETSSPNEILVIVDNEPALENVTRFLSAKGYTHSYERTNKLWRITAIRDSGAACEVMDEQELQYHATREGTRNGEDARTLVMIISPFFGSGDDVLGAKLMKNFISTLPEMGRSLWRIVMLNGGVQLAAEGSHILEELIRLESSGVSILVCGTCLEHFNLMEKKAVGETTNMLDVVTSMQLADKVIRV